MIKVSVMYPNSTDVKFDIDYYKNNHLPMVIKSLGTALKQLELDIAVPSNTPEGRAPYVAIAHLKFDDMTSFQTAFAPHGAAFAADVENYSNVQAVLQISEVVTL